MMNYITSKNNDRVKKIASLSEKKYRDEYKLFTVDGIKLVKEALNANANLDSLYISESKREQYLQLLKDENYNISEEKIYILSDDVFAKITQEKAPQGIVACLSYLDKVFFGNIINNIYNKTILLYSIQDPGNLGAILRSALAFGVENVILSLDSVDVYNSKVLRASMGSVFHLNIAFVSDFEKQMMVLQEMGRNIYAAELRPNAVPLSSIILQKNDCFLIGNEGHGIPLNISNKCNRSVYLPISESSESLNASVAASIFMWELGKAN